MEPNLLLLGGTAGANTLAAALAGAGIRATYSYAGRVDSPRPQPLPVRQGGFGGAAGLELWLRDNAITHVVDATHPFAAQMSVHAAHACDGAGVPLAALTRAPWQAEPQDDWRHVPDIAGALSALDRPPCRVFLAIGRQQAGLFSAAPQHFYLLRFVDAPEAAPLPDCHVEIARGPFDPDRDMALMQAHRIDLVVSKNSGGSGARAKLDAARALGLPVVMIDRPPAPRRAEFHDVADILNWIHHST